MEVVIYSISKEIRKTNYMQYYVVDAFAEKLFEGNPAGACIFIP